MFLTFSQTQIPHLKKIKQLRNPVPSSRQQGHPFGRVSQCLRLVLLLLLNPGIGAHRHTSLADRAAQGGSMAAGTS